MKHRPCGEVSNFKSGTIDQAKANKAVKTLDKIMNGTEPENENTVYGIIIFSKRDGSTAYFSSLERGIAVQILRDVLERKEQQILEGRTGPNN